MANNKQANDLLHQALIGLLLGGGTYGGMRTAKSIFGGKKQEQQQPGGQGLEVALPADRMPKLGQEKQANSGIGSLLGLLGGAGLGHLTGEGLSHAAHNEADKHFGAYVPPQADHAFNVGGTAAGGLAGMLGGGAAGHYAEQAKKNKTSQNPDDATMQQLQAFMNKAQPSNEDATMRQLQGFMNKQSADKQANSSVMDYLGPVLGYGGGGLLGFHGASALYEKMKQQEMKKKIQTNEQEYLKTLQQVGGKIASLNTPYVDAFVAGITDKLADETFNKVADGPDLTDAIGATFRSGWNSFSGSDTGKATIAAWLLAAGLGGGTTYALGKRMDNQKEHNMKQTELPHDIRLKQI